MFCDVGVGDASFQNHQQGARFLKFMVTVLVFINKMIQRFFWCKVRLVPVR